MAFDDEEDLFYQYCENLPYTRVFVECLDIEPLDEATFDYLMRLVLPSDLSALCISGLVHQVTVLQVALDRLVLELDEREFFPFRADRDGMVPFIVPYSRFVDSPFVVVEEENEDMETALQ